MKELELIVLDEVVKELQCLEEKMNKIINLLHKDAKPSKTPSPFLKNINIDIKGQWNKYEKWYWRYNSILHAWSVYGNSNHSDYKSFVIRATPKAERKPRIYATMRLTQSSERSSKYISDLSSGFTRWGWSDPFHWKSSSIREGPYVYQS